MSPSRKSDKPHHTRGSHATRRHRIRTSAAAPPPLAEWSKLGAELCSGLAGWARGFAQTAIEHAIPPAEHIGAIAWLACVALRDEERTA